MTQEVVLKIDQAGGVAIEALGFADNSCATATKEMERAFLAIKRTDTKKPEYHNPAKTSQNNTLKKSW